ncbi:MAG: hypothetical protein JWO09_3657 [Bacteroidetes bacterium]|nr:hypothetical protein [Bacteroidota bacterium]
MPDTEEITRICKEYAAKKSYALAFSKSIDLGIITDVMPLVQEAIPQLPGSLINAWTIELRQLLTVSYLSMVTKAIPEANVRLVGIKNIPNQSKVVFSFAFNFKDIDPPIKAEGISLLSFGVTVIVSPNGAPGKKSKLVIMKSNSRSEKFTILKKAS